MRGCARSCVVGHARRSCAVVRGRARSCAAMRGRAWSCVRGRACQVVHARSCVRGRACVVGRAWSCRSARFAAITAVRTNERTTSNNPLNPPGVGWVNLFYHIKVRCLWTHACQDLGPIKRLVRKICLSNL